MDRIFGWKMELTSLRNVLVREDYQQGKKRREREKERVTEGPKDTHSHQLVVACLLFLGIITESLAIPRGASVVAKQVQRFPIVNMSVYGTKYAGLTYFDW